MQSRFAIFFVAMLLLVGNANSENTGVADSKCQEGGSTVFAEWSQHLCNTSAHAIQVWLTPGKPVELTPGIPDLRGAKGHVSWLACYPEASSDGEKSEIHFGGFHPNGTQNQVILKSGQCGVSTSDRPSGNIELVSTGRHGIQITVLVFYDTVAK